MVGPGMSYAQMITGDFIVARQHAAGDETLRNDMF
jgi:acetolactate synthase-1/2/3 large subunit